MDLSDLRVKINSETARDEDWFYVKGKVSLFFEQSPLMYLMLVAHSAFILLLTSVSSQKLRLKVFLQFPSTKIALKWCKDSDPTARAWKLDILPYCQGQLGGAVRYEGDGDVSDGDGYPLTEINQPFTKRGETQKLMIYRVGQTSYGSQTVPEFAPYLHELLCFQEGEGMVVHECVREHRPNFLYIPLLEGGDLPIRIFKETKDGEISDFMKDAVDLRDGLMVRTFNDFLVLSALVCEAYGLPRFLTSCIDSPLTNGSFYCLDMISQHFFWAVPLHQIEQLYGLLGLPRHEDYTDITFEKKDVKEVACHELTQSCVRDVNVISSVTNQSIDIDLNSSELTDMLTSDWRKTHYFNLAGTAVSFPAVGLFTAMQALVTPVTCGRGHLIVPQFVSSPTFNQRSFDSGNVKQRIYDGDLSRGNKSPPMMNTMLGTTDYSFRCNKMVGAVVKRETDGELTGLLDCKLTPYTLNEGLVRFKERIPDVALMKCPLTTYKTLDVDECWIGDRMSRHVEKACVETAWENLFAGAMPGVAASYGDGREAPGEGLHNLRGVLCFANLLSTMSKTFSLGSPSTDVVILLGHLTSRLRVYMDLPDFFWKPQSIESGLLLARIYTQVLSGQMSVPQVDGQGRLLCSILSQYRLPPDVECEMANIMMREPDDDGADNWKPLPPPDWVMLGQSFDIDFMVLPKLHKGELVASHDVKVCQHISQKIQAGQSATASTSWGDISRKLLSDLAETDGKKLAKLFPNTADYTGTLSWLSEYLVRVFGSSPMVMNALLASKLGQFEDKKDRGEDARLGIQGKRYSTGIRSFPNIKTHGSYLEVLNLCIFATQVLLYDPIKKTLCNLQPLQGICQSQGRASTRAGDSKALTGLHDKWDQEKVEDVWRYSGKRDFFIVSISATQLAGRLLPQRSLTIFIA